MGSTTNLNWWVYRISAISSSEHWTEMVGSFQARDKWKMVSRKSSNSNWTRGMKGWFCLQITENLRDALFMDIYG